MNFQQLILSLQSFWAQQGCILGQPYDVEKGAGTANPHTFLRCLGPEPWNVAYVEPCRRPTDGRYGENPNRLGAYYQFQVILKPSPKDVLDLYLRSLVAIGIKPKEHDIRFVEDDWEQPTLGAWGLGWEVWLDGMEITQFTYFQQVGGIECRPVCAELTYGLERIAMYLQKKNSILDLEWGGGFTYADVHKQTEVEWSRYNFEEADPDALFAQFDICYAESKRLAEKGLVYPSYDHALRCSHLFNTLDARGAISVSERAAYIGRIRDLARLSAQTFVEEREKLGWPILNRQRGPVDVEAEPTYDDDPAGDTMESTKAVAPVGPSELLIELGCEEVPARMLPGAAAALRDRVTRVLKANGVEHGDARVAWTPRRICVVVDEVDSSSARSEELVTGPPTRICFADDGTPKVPAIKFAQGQGVDVGDLERVQTPKGEYLALRRAVGGEPTAVLLEDELPGVIAGIPWPKSMRWGSRDERFVRPLHWIVALLGGNQLRFEWAGVHSGNLTWGHRFFGNESAAVWSFGTLRDALAERSVLIDPAERATAIREQLREVAAEHGGRPVEDEALVQIVTGLVEAPRVVAGTFDSAFLSLPREVIQTVLTEHQKMFVVEGDDGLLPVFLGVSNNPTADQPNTRAGYEKVAVARLKDGVFFYDNDRRKTLDVHCERLSGITFLKGAGSMADRAARIAAVVTAIGGAVPPDDQSAAKRAADLCKADLCSEMVGEFPKLQGVMGAYYARHHGEPEPVAAAIAEHYMPRGADDGIPASVAGSLVALADKADTLAACFALGKKPTGSADPFGLRRAALGILRILDEGPVELAVDALLDAAVAGVADLGKRDPAEVRSDLGDYLRTRLKGMWSTSGTTDVAEAVLLAGWSDVRDGRARLAALGALRGSDDFTDLMVAFKRMGNIVRKAGDGGGGVEVDAGLLAEEAERDLFAAFVAMRSDITGALDAGDHAAALGSMASLRAPLASFFDHVMVMADDADVRHNRLALLRSISGAFGRIADFSAISTE